MARYIDVENVDLETIHTSHMGYSSKADISDWLNEQPTADVEEVKHGCWKVNVGMNFNKERICPICGEEIKGNHWNFCSNCGAKMDGGKAE